MARPRPEPRLASPLGRGPAGEALEQARHELGRDAVAAILDDDGQLSVARAGRDRHGGSPVEQRVREQVPDDAVEGRVHRQAG